MPYRANAGVRIARTRLSVDTFLNVGTVATLVNDKNSYTNVLPSANIAFNVTDKFLIRLSGSQTLQRASIADLAPSTFFNATNLSVTGGNAALKPPKSTQGDISLEYYTGKSSLISGAVFYKDVKDFIASFVTSGIDTTLDPAGRTLTFSRPENLASAKIKGFEVGVQQFFDFLPAPFDGFGIIANYTYSDSKDNAGFPLVAVSKNSYNLVGLYEKGRAVGAAGLQLPRRGGVRILRRPAELHRRALAARRAARLRHLETFRALAPGAEPDAEEIGDQRVQQLQPDRAQQLRLVRTTLLDRAARKVLTKRVPGLPKGRIGSP